jgi:SAM-dependent methyltransferase
LGATDHPLDRLYQHRFEAREREKKLAVWRVLCENYFQDFVRPGDTVLDLGAGFCEFINNIRASRRIAVDANPCLADYAALGVESVNVRAEDLTSIGTDSVNVVFTSNFFEHLSNKESLSSVIQAIHRVLKPEGLLIAMGPNIKYLPGAYWDYYDHHVALTEKSVDELFHLAGFRTIVQLSRFMPYTVKSRLPSWPWLVRLYLRLGRVTFPILGKQFLVIGRKLPLA